ncbi:MBG domain-containing protein [Limosilactobacillus ingluviei]|uniref:MBG domain-containing protein n=1 Tax=Limosilactobacillus ingluviei TaxID=148604 RepID=UPI0023F128A8|nr:MBG domain-containing protein [Limosilactobacillus ingluviei]
MYVVKKTSAEKTTPKVPETKEPVVNTSSLTETEKAKVQKNVEDANKGNFPDGTTVTVGDDGTATINYPDKSSETIPGSELVRPATDAEKTTPKVPETKEPVVNTSSLTETEKAKVQKNVEDANKGNFPDGTTVTVGDDGTATINYPDKSVDTIPGNKLVEEKTDTPTPTEKTVNVVFKGVDKKYDGKPAEVTVTITDQDGKDVDVTLEAGKDYTITKQSAAKARMLLATAKPLTDAPTEVGTYHVALTETGKQKLKDAGYTTVNETPADFTISPADTPTPTPDTKTDDEKYDPIIPGDKVKVDDPTKLTNEEKDEVVKAVEDANKDDNGDSTLPDGTKITVDNDGTTTVTYPDGTKDTIDGDKLVEPANPSDTKTGDQTNDPKVPGDKVKVDDPTKLTDDEKGEVAKAVEDANKDDNGDSTLPDGTKITVDNDGTTTVTYPDGTKDTIDGDQLVEKKNDADKNEPNVPGDKVKVDDPTKLTDDEKGEVVKAVEDANKDDNGNSTLPDGTKIMVDDNGDVTVTYLDGSKDTIPGDKVVEGKDNGGETGDQTDAEKNNPAVPGDKVKVDDPAKLTDDEKEDVVKAVEDANKDDNGNSTLPDGTKITVDDNGDVTVTYPDGSEDTIPGDKVVEGKTDADKNEPNVPSEDDKVKVDDPTKLTDGEKEDVVKTVEDANKDDNGNSTLPDGTKITVGDNGDVTVTYPDGSEDTIPGDKVVEGKTDADKNEPNVPSEDDKVKVDDPTKLTDGEKEDVVKAVEDANKDKDGNSTLSDGTKITVGDNGDVTVTYPDGSKDTIPGDKVVEGKTDADKTDVTVPGTKVEVGDPTKLTDGEKGQVEEAIKDANPNLPNGTKITVADDGTATILYPDGSYKVIDGQDLVTKPGQTTADQVTPVVPGDKVTVVDPNHLTDAEKDQVKTNVEKANQNNFPAGTVVMVADDGTATITYPDGSVDQISAADLITKPTAAGQAGKGTGTTTTNGQGAPAGQGKADQAKTLPQTGNEQGSLLAASGLGMLLLGMLGLGGKRKKED